MTLTQRRYGTLAAGLVFVAAMALWGYATVRDTVPEGLAMGEPAPAFELSDLEGNRVSLADFAGTPLILRFSSRTCTFCYDDFGHLESLQRSYGDELQVVAVELGAPRDMVRDAVRGRNESYPVLMDAAGEAAEAYRLTGLPQVYFINADGLLLSRAWGELQEMDVRPNLAQILRPDGRAFASVDEEVRAIASEVRCQECQGLSAWQSQVPSAWEMREEIRELLAEGLTRGEVLDELVDRHGTWILMRPPAEGRFLWAYILPFAVIGLGGLAAHWLLNRRRPPAGPDTQEADEELDPEAEERVRRRLQEYL